MLGRKVELVVFDDKSSASEDAGDLDRSCSTSTRSTCSFAPYGTVPTAPIMPMVKQRDLLLIGNFSFQVEPHGQATTSGSTTRRGGPPSNSRGARLHRLGHEGGCRFYRADRSPTRSSRRIRREIAQGVGHREEALKIRSTSRATAVRPPSSRPWCAPSVPRGPGMCVLPPPIRPNSAGLLRAVNEIGVGDSVRVFGGGMVGLQFGPVMESDGLACSTAWSTTTPTCPRTSMEFAGGQGILRSSYRQARHRGQVDPLGYYLAPFGYAMGPDGRAGRRRPPSRSTRRQLAEFLRTKGDADHRRTDRLRPRRRAQGIGHPDGAVPRRRRQEHRAVPRPREADHPVPSRSGRPATWSSRSRRRARVSGPAIAPGMKAPDFAYARPTALRRSSTCWTAATACGCWQAGRA